MDLQFKIVQKEILESKKFKEVQQKVKDSVGKELSIIIDFGSIEGLTEVSTKNKIPERLVFCRYWQGQGLDVYQQAIREACQTEIGKAGLAQTFDVVVIHGGEGGKDYQYGDQVIEIRGNELHFTTLFLKKVLAAEGTVFGINAAEGANLGHALLKLMDLQFKIVQKEILESKKFKEFQQKVNEAVGKEIPIIIDFGSIEGLTEEVAKNKIPERLVYCQYWQGTGLEVYKQAICQICSNEVGKETFAEAFDCLIIHGGEGGTNHATHTPEIRGKELHFTTLIEKKILHSGNANWASNLAMEGGALKNALMKIL